MWSMMEAQVCLCMLVCWEGGVAIGMLYHLTLRMKANVLWWIFINLYFVFVWHEYVFLRKRLDAMFLVSYFFHVLTLFSWLSIYCTIKSSRLESMTILLVHLCEMCNVELALYVARNMCLSHWNHHHHQRITWQPDNQSTGISFNAPHVGQKMSLHTQDIYCTLNTHLRHILHAVRAIYPTAAGDKWQER